MSENRHILFITTSFPSTGNKSGCEAAGSFVADFVEALSEREKVTLIAPTQNLVDDECLGNLTIRRFVVPFLPLSRLMPYNPFHWPLIFKTLKNGQNAISQVVKETKVDHIVAMWALPSGYWARNIWKTHCIPYSIWALGSDIWSLRKLPIVKNTLADVLKDSQICFADGYQLKQDVETISGRSCKFLASSRNLPIVEKKRLSTTPPYRLAFLGRFHPNKGIDLMLDSLRLLSDTEWDKIEEIRICGGGPLERHVMSAVAVLERGGRPVSVGGYLNKKEAAELLAWADYLLLPSRIESIPVVFSDAMQAGCPVIASPVGDLPRLLGENMAGVLADNVSSSAFAAAICSALKIPPKNFNDGLEQVSTKFSLQETVKIVHQLLSEQ